MNSLEEIALKVAKEQGCWSTASSTGDLAEFARRLVAALGAQEPVAIFDGFAGNIPCFGQFPDQLNIGTKLFAAPVLPSVPEEWQPIETAPKGELIAIWIARTNKFGEKWSETIGECWLYCYHDSICGEWRTTRPSGHLRCVPERFVTHWTRNPAAPSPQEDKS